jgi:hypothetical protein
MPHRWAINIGQIPHHFAINCNKYYINKSHFGSNWVVSEKIHTPPMEEIPAVRRGRGEKICF